MTLQIILVISVTNSPLAQQLFGRTGRGLGFITWLSLIAICLIASFSISNSNSKRLLSGLGISGLFAIIYSIFQSYGLDFFPWDSKTNGVIGTLGNPNFVSSFTAMISLPTAVYISSKFASFKSKVLANVFVFTIVLLSIYRAQSFQGYITLLIAISFFMSIFFWYRQKFVFSVLVVLLILGSCAAIAGVFNKGPLAQYLFKVSIQSRGEFWASAVGTIKSHPFFGVGLDSFGDYFLKYRERATINEFTDSAHNYFLDYAANAGLIFAILNLTLVLLTLYSFFKLQTVKGKFDGFLASLFSAFLVFQAQSLISPISIPLICWNMVISGSVIGLLSISDKSINDVSINKILNFKISSLYTALLGVLLVFPYVNSDRLQLIAMNNGDGDLAIKVAKMYPESVVRYSVLTRALLESGGLTQPALDLARSAVKFNPNAPALWALILINESAPISERQAAYEILLKLDPLNEELINYRI
jgi:O-antigen ligase